ncbi:MAG: hypothetical protein ACREBU_03210 [Nitrososphaera sp.]
MTQEEEEAKVAWQLAKNAELTWQLAFKAKIDVETEFYKTKSGNFGG